MLLLRFSSMGQVRLEGGLLSEGLGMGGSGMTFNLLAQYTVYNVVKYNAVKYNLYRNIKRIWIARSCYHDKNRVRWNWNVHILIGKGARPV